jgi:hypothetical protein
VEYTPFPWLTLTDNVDTIDYHVSGEAMLSTLYLNATSLFGPGAVTNPRINEVLDTLFVYNEVKNQAEAEFALGHGFAVRAGHRYQYVEARSEDSEDVNASDFSRRTALVGMVYRPGRWLRLGVDYEKSKTNRVLTRTDLLNFDRVNVDWRIGSWKGLGFNGRMWVQRNSNLVPDIGLKTHDQNYSAGVSYDPSERLSLSVDFTHADLFSDLLIVIPQNLQSARSIFSEKTSGIGGRMALGLYKKNKLEVGYRGVINRGEYPLEFHQPYASLWIPLGGNLALKPGWQYFGYSQDLFGFENYQTHLFTFSLVYTR